LVLQGFTPIEIRALLLAAQELTTGVRDEVVVAGHTMGDVQLRWRVAARDAGIRHTPPRFECALRPSTWANVEGLLEPFADGGSGYQWLDTSGEVALLVSPDGTW
jgi:hypothetical protein